MGLTKEHFIAVLVMAAFIIGFSVGCQSTTKTPDPVNMLKIDPGTGAAIVSYEQLYMDERPTGVYLVHMKFDEVRQIEWEAIFDNGDVLLRQPTGQANDWVIWLTVNEQWSMKPAEVPAWLDSLIVK